MIKTNLMPIDDKDNHDDNDADNQGFFVKR